MAVSDIGVQWPEIIRPALKAATLGPVTVDLTTMGRRTGVERRIEIWTVVVDDRLIITGTPRPRDWLANLLADQRCTLHFKNDTSAKGITADVHCIATEILVAEARREVLEHPATVWYRNQSPLPDLLARSPMVELRPAMSWAG